MPAFLGKTTELLKTSTIRHKCHDFGHNFSLFGSPSLGGGWSASPLLRYLALTLNPMLLQKTLHMNQSLEECKTRLASIQSYRRQFVMVTKATVTSSKTVDFSFRGPLGFEARTVLLAVESDSPDTFAFESTGGNLDVMGLAEFTEIRPNCTEVTLALHYEIKNKLFAWLDRRFHFVDAFVTSELRSIRSHFEGIAAPVAERTPMLHMYETATA